MKIAAILAGAALGALMLSPVAAQATASPPEPPPSKASDFSPSQQADIAAGVEFATETDEAPPRQLKKRKTPQFQTRFFGE